MAGLADRIRRHLTYANVVATATAFAVLAGGTAIAANQLAKSSVGAKQLKANAVTTAKIKKNAVTKAKIKNGAVDGTKVADASLGLADLEQASLPFGHVVHETVGTGTVAAPPGPGFGTLPLASPSYTQEAGRNDTVVGAADITFAASCEPPRAAIVYALLDTPDPAKLEEGDLVALGVVFDEKTGGALTARADIGPTGSAGPLQPPAAVGHTLSMITLSTCKAGSGASVSNAVLNVIGVK